MYVYNLARKFDTMWRYHQTYTNNLLEVSACMYVSDLMQYQIELIALITSILHRIFVSSTKLELL